MYVYIVAYMYIYIYRYIYIYICNHEYNVPSHWLSHNAFGATHELGHMTHVCRKSIRPLTYIYIFYIYAYI